MKNTLQLTTLVIATVLFAACSPETGSLSTMTPVVQPTPPKFAAPTPLEQAQRPVFATPTPLDQTQKPAFDKVNEEKSAWMTEDGGQNQLEFNPQVDILFVIDNSASMESAQANLVRNINQFTSKFAQKKDKIDFHVGVISTWDSSERFATMKKDPYGIGELRFVKDNGNKNYNARFVTRKEQPLMASTLNIGVAALAQGGPENEEFFAPIVSALEKSGRGAANEGFFRPDAQLVIVVMTDADDSKAEFTHEQVVSRLVNFKDGQKNKISVYGVLTAKGDKEAFKDPALHVDKKNNPQCFEGNKVVDACKGGLGPQNLEQFILAANSDAGTAAQVKSKYIVSIVKKDFGADLANIGSDIKRKTMAKEILLSQVPVVENQQVQVRVRYGTPAELAAGKGLVIPQSRTAGWLYSPENNSILLSGDIDYPEKDGARFAVDLKAAILK